MRRIMAFLLCLCMVLAMVPSNFAFMAKAAANDTLVLDASKKGLCPVCNETVTWVAYSGSSRLGTFTDGSHKHYYLSGDVSTGNLNSSLLRLGSKSTLCLHLNGHNINYSGYMQCTGSTLNIMGSGNVTFTGNASTTDGYWKFGIYVTSSGKVNLLGGTYNVAETALENGVPMINQTSGTFTIGEGVTVNGPTNIAGGSLKLSKTANVENIQVATGSKLIVAADWTGSAKASFAAGLTDNLVPAANGVAEGAFTGKLTGPSAVTYSATAEGRLQASGFNAGLVLDENNQALCPVCNEIVTWTAKSGTSRLGSFTDGTHRHYYLTGDVTYGNGTSSLVRLGSGSDMCLHLNGHNIAFGGYMDVSASTLNIMGVGNMTFTGNAPTTGGYWKFGIYVRSSGTANLYGGTYKVAEAALENGVPMIAQLSGKVNIKDAEVYGVTDVDGGTLTIDQTAILEDIQVAEEAKLTVAKTWTGKAKVGFAAALVDGVVPTANGTAGGVFTGKLTYTGGRALNGTEEGTLVLDDPNKNLVFDENNQALCPHCNKVVTWTALTGNKTFNGGTHHYYLTKSLDWAAGSTNFLRTYGGATLCLHLNGFDITHGSRMFIQSTLTIMGHGNVTFTATGGNADSKLGGIRSTGTVNLLGGTYGTAGNAATEGLSYISQTGGTLNMQSATLNGLNEFSGSAVTMADTTVNGTFSLNAGTLTIDGATSFQDLQVGTSAKLMVNQSWTGSAVVTFAAGIENNMVPTANGEAAGAFTGKLTTPDGSTLEGFSDGTIRKVVKLELDANNQGYCPACDATVTWTAYSGTSRLGSFTDGKHRHYYLDGDVTYENADNSLFRATGEGTAVCLHLNDHNITTGSYIQVSSLVNIMGTGNVTFTGNADPTTGYWKFALYVTGGTLNLMGGNYSVAGTAVENGILTFYQQTATAATTFGDVTVSGAAQSVNGTLTLSKTANLEMLQVDGGKLIVEEGWAGKATASFTVGLVNGALPTANGASTGSFNGGLALTDGTLLKGEDGKLVVNDYAELLLDDYSRGYCLACDKIVTWKPIHDGENIGILTEGDLHVHYYFADDNITAKSTEFLYEKPGNTVCLHLNNKTVKVPGRMRIHRSTLNIMGDGNVEYLAATGNSSYDSHFLYCWGSPYSPGAVLRIYGGTFTTASGMPLVAGNGTYSSVMSKTYLYGNTHIDGFMTLDQAHVYLHDNVTVGRIDASNTGSVRVDESWAGTAEVTYLADMYEEYVNIFNGRSTGDYVGGLIMDGKRLIGESGRLRIVDIMDLRLNSDNLGYCAACNEVVTWTALNGSDNIGTYTDGSHQHFYLAGDVDNQAAEDFLNLSESSDVCLHLNGHSITHNAPMVVANGSALNILGKGNVTYCGDTAKGGIVSSGTVNLLGGNYTVIEAAERAALPTIYQADGQITVKNAVIDNSNYLEKGTLTLDGSASLSSIHIDTAGRLSVADTWTGEAKVEFATGLTGKYAPASNISISKATGKLTLLDGRELVVEQDGLAIGNVKVPSNITYKLYDTYAEILSCTGSDVILLPTQIAGKPVTQIASGAFASFTGTLYIGKGDAVGLAYAQAEGISYTEIAAINGNVGYATVEDALNEYESGVVQLLTDVNSISVNKDTYLDLNGFDVADVAVVAGTLYVMDSQTDDFTVADGNYGKITGSISGTVKAVPANAACAEYGYLQVSEAAGISFHCVAMDIYAVTLRPDVSGVNYDCTFSGDEVVASLVKSYGVALSVYGDPDETRKDWCYTEYTDFAAGENDKNTLLTNVMRESNGDVQNQANANTPIYGRAYIKTDSGYIFGQTICRDLQEQTELTDLHWEDMTKETRKNTRAMYEAYQSVMGDWDMYHTPKYEDRIWFTEPAPDTGAGWEQYSLPLGNGYLGTSVFGGTDIETLVFSDKTMYNPGSSAQDDEELDIPDDEAVMGGSSVGSNGFTNLCKLKIDFGHNFDQVTNYQRDLLLDTAEARVFYDYQGVTYNRTYFANYPDNVTVAKLDASQKGALSFTLRPTPTYIRDHLWLEGDGLGKTGTVTASGDTAILSGTLAAYQINYEIQFKVVPVGGTMTANADGTITVENADSAMILITASTNYEMKPETMTAPKNEKLDPNSFPHDKVTAVMNAAAEKSYEELRQTHLEDYQSIYGRVSTDLSGEPSTTIPTNKQMQEYRAGDHSIYVEELLFKHGRYLLIASSREGTLPANLQGMWQYYAGAAWRGGYVYNINLQMNYWSCYATNLLDMFETNFDYFDAMWDTMETNADNYLTGVKSPWISEKGTGANGIAIGASGTPYSSASVTASVGAHSGPATTAYTTSLLWDYYTFTGDKKALEEKIWPYIEGCAIFLDKTLEEYDGLWLVSHSASPENNMWFGNGAPDGPEITVGCMFDQMFVYETFCQVLEAAEILGYTEADAPILTNIKAKIDKLDHVIVGKDGHVKEFREEEYYGEFGRYEHHGMAQLVGVYPATSITSETDAWQDAATVTATERGINYTGHQSSFKQLVWARLGNSDYAYLLAQDHISKYLRNNMWNTHTPFQIDGNFGYTAGVAEMLVQSHEGYISVLPALPEAWAANGSYAGLTARGGFEVGAAWTDGSATEITITSKIGGDAKVKYFMLSTAKVTDSKGNVVPFTVDERDIITFATEAGETYTISELTEKVTVDAPSALTLTNGTNMSWTASPDAASYNIYRAVNSQASYELIAEGVTGTSYAYVPTDLKAGDQLILRVTAVNADGVESTGIRALTWDFEINEADALAMQAANAAYTAYIGETAKYMLYEYEGRVVVLFNGSALNVYDSADAALKTIYDDSVTAENEADLVTLVPTTEGWYIVDEGYSQHTYVAFGDSITYGYDGDAYARMENPYPTLVADTLGIGTVVNQAKNGATLTAREGRTNMTERILSYEGDADIISVMLGVNDYSAKAALGDMDSRDNTTVYGSLHMAARHLTNKYPDAFIFFMTPFKYKTENNGTYNLADVAQAVKDVAAAYNIPVLDMYTNGQFNPATDAKDQIHPTQAHHETYTAPMICEFIEAHYDPQQGKK
ncbi:MAG: glycoside hydrolase N-terminal domain-containing protein [Oscillospiraceae bacterium]|nr:glycoside hydrolase N-terminal domain-containing protein [Oscillospiraceae bacterium]